MPLSNQLLLLVLTGLVVAVLVCRRHQICSALGSVRWHADQFAHQLNWDILPAPPGQVQRRSGRGVGVEQDASEACIHETLLDFFGNPFKLTVPEILLAIMPKGGERPAPESDENIVQPESNGAPVPGVETPSQPGNGQTVFARDDEDEVTRLRRQLAQVQAKLDQQQAKESRQRELNRQRWQRWRANHVEEDRQRSADYRKRKRQEREQGRNNSP